jgi:hypothetical protein
LLQHPHSDRRFFSSHRAGNADCLPDYCIQSKTARQEWQAVFTYKLWPFAAFDRAVDRRRSLLISRWIGAAALDYVAFIFLLLYANTIMYSDSFFADIQSLSPPTGAAPPDSFVYAAKLAICT